MKCQASDVQYLSNPPQNQCKKCGRFWYVGKEIPECVPITHPLNRESVEEKLWIEVMENYVTTAELGHLAKDQKTHKDEMRACFKELVDYQLSELRTYITSKIEEVEGKYKSEKDNESYFSQLLKQDLDKLK